MAQRYTYRISAKNNRHEIIETGSLAELYRILVGGPMLEKNGDTVNIVTQSNRMLSVTKQAGALHHTHYGHIFN